MRANVENLALLEGKMLIPSDRSATVTVDAQLTPWNDTALLHKSREGFILGIQRGSWALGTPITETAG